MVLYNFQSRWADPVAQRVKTRTIRAPRKGKSRHARPGDRLQLYTNVRRPERRKLITEDPLCTRSVPVAIYENRATEDGQDIGPDFLHLFAELDGFECFEDMVDFFRAHHGLPFFGQLIEWEGPAPSPAPEGRVPVVVVVEPSPGNSKKVRLSVSGEQDWHDDALIMAAIQAAAFHACTAKQMDAVPWESRAPGMKGWRSFLSEADLHLIHVLEENGYCVFSETTSGQISVNDLGGLPKGFKLGGFKT